MVLDRNIYECHISADDRVEGNQICQDAVQAVEKHALGVRRVFVAGGNIANLLSREDCSAWASGLLVRRRRCSCSGSGDAGQRRNLSHSEECSLSEKIKTSDHTPLFFIWFVFGHVSPLKQTLKLRPWLAAGGLCKSAGNPFFSQRSRSLKKRTGHLRNSLLTVTIQQAAIPLQKLLPTTTTPTTLNITITTSQHQQQQLTNSHTLMTVNSSTSSSSNASAGPIISTLSNPTKQAITPVLDNNNDSNNIQQSTTAHRNHAQRNTQRRSFEQQQQQVSSGRSRLNPGGKDYVPSSTSTSTSSTSSTSTTTAQSRRAGKAAAGGRIDDDHSQESSDRKQHSNNTGKQQQGRRGGNRHPGNSSSGISGPTSNRNPARSQKKELSGRTFPSAQTQGHSHQEHDQSGESTSSHTHTHNVKNEHHRRNRTTTRSRAPAPFVHKVEEDRGLLEALTVGLTNSTYDCMVCWDVIRPAHRIWNCQVCWAAFHLDCLSTWAKKSSEGMLLLACCATFVYLACIEQCN